MRIRSETAVTNGGRTWWAHLAFTRIKHCANDPPQKRSRIGKKAARRCRSQIEHPAIGVPLTTPERLIVGPPLLNAAFHRERSGSPSPVPPTGVVTTRSLKPAISGLPFAMASLTDGRDSEVSWLALLSPASLIQIAFASVMSVATM